MLLATSAASAQTADGGPAPTVRLRIGPVWVNPTISLPNIGIDTNVFNEPANVIPKKDFTITVSPKAELWLRLGRTWLSGIIAGEMVWYQTYASERSTDSTYGLGWKAPLNRLVLSTNAEWVKTRSRPGFEIDTRAERDEPAYAGSVEVRGLSKTFIGVRGGWREVLFDNAAAYEGESLKRELDRTETAAAVTVRHDLTPLTSVMFSAGRSEERFTYSPSRDATADDYSGTLNFDPAALLKGSASFGYKDYQPQSPDVAPFQGAIYEVNLSYILLGSTRFSTNLRRDVESSYDIDQPYYLLTGGGASITQQIYGPVDAVGRAILQRLEYRTREGTTVAAPDRTDRIRNYGGGVGVRMGEELRLGFNIDDERRTSVLEDREYKGLRYGVSITYGQ